ncbi:biotin transporter BioY [Lyngbya confervoides]|uniref:Biotin transporter n=1 Tax=Lyngbya confervoides BDU141951 TaxID=1574623 RepID=A0ABD4T4P9_9CYAN|nr:biotin transporter BioY [Lyngbya confervoides]MCM1983494.1 biotin transporter BioY [Lyngbya confervoides BDU141951]
MVLSAFDQFLWAIIGLLLTISGVFIEVAIPIPLLTWPIDLSEISTETLGVTLQLGAVLFVACMGGRNAAALSQIAYLALGLSGFQVFAQGGGLSYFREPTFGYLLGFLLGAWVCGDLAFRLARKIESLMVSALAGLGIIHGCGVVYFSLLALVRQLPGGWWSTFLNYSLLPLPGQLIILCAVVFCSLLLRKILLY